MSGADYSVLLPKLQAALVAAYGTSVGMDAAAEAVTWAYENSARMADITNPGGYLYRVGQTAAKKLRKPDPVPEPTFPKHIPDIEPGLLEALNSLSEAQRVCVVMVHALDYRQVEVASVLEISESSVRTHLNRALQKLRKELKVDHE